MAASVVSSRFTAATTGAAPNGCPPVRDASSLAIWTLFLPFKYSLGELRHDFAVPAAAGQAGLLAWFCSLVIPLARGSLISCQNLYTSPPYPPSFRFWSTPSVTALLLPVPILTPVNWVLTSIIYIIITRREGQTIGLVWRSQTLYLTAILRKDLGTIMHLGCSRGMW